MEDKRFSILRANDLFLGARRGHLGTAVLEKNLLARYTYEKFQSDPVTACKAGGAANGATGKENMMGLGSNMFEYYILGAGQTILAPSLVATGLLVSLDLTDNMGCEITQGILARSKQAFVIGTDEFYFKLKFSIADISGTDDCAMGFRLAEDYQAAIDGYQDMAILNVISGAIKIETEAGGGGTTTTDTTNTWIDGATHTLEVYVDLAGAVTYKIDGADPTVVAAYSFTDALTVIPFFHFLHATTLPGNIILQEWECGLQ